LIATDGLSLPVSGSAANARKSAFAQLDGDQGANSADSPASLGTGVASDLLATNFDRL
jgi:hypothetical protein